MKILNIPLLLFLLSIFYFESGHAYPEIQIFSRKDPVYDDLRKKILSYNKKQNLPLFFYSYRVKENDTFFKIANKIDGWQSSVATMNLIDSPFVSTGQEILIPNKKGIFVLDSKSYRFNNLLLATRDLKKAEKVKVRRGSKIYEFYFFDAAKETEYGVFSSTEMLFFLDSNFILPLKHFFVTSDFGFRSDPFTGHKSYHSGIDLSSPMHSEVFASSYGTVVGVGYSKIYGNFVIILHKNNIKSLYGHLDSYNVASGDVVKSGELIGRVGVTGRTTGPHLHFEILKENVPIDPNEHVK